MREFSCSKVCIINNYSYLCSKNRNTVGKADIREKIYMKKEKLWTPSFLAIGGGSFLLFFAFYLVIILIGWTILLFLGVGFSESVSTVISSIGNVGPGLGSCGPAYSWNSLPDLAKWVLSFLMLIGRLELFSVLLLFYPGFWKNR